MPEAALVPLGLSSMREPCDGFAVEVSYDA